MSDLGLALLLFAVWFVGCVVVAAATRFFIEDREYGRRMGFLLGIWWPGMVPLAALLGALYGATALLEKAARKVIGWARRRR